MGRRVLLLLLLAGCDVVFGLEREAVPGEWSKVASGSAHSCAIQTDQSLWCWGDHATGAVGVGTAAEFEVLAPARVGTDRWTEVAAGGGYTCGIRDDQTLWCWGANGVGAVGDGTHETRDAPVQIGTDKWRAVTAGDASTCGIRSDGSLWCWGANSLAQLGDGTLGERDRPTLIDAAHDWTEVSMGLTHACALTGEELWCWGTIGTKVAMTPTRIEAGTAWAHVAAGNGSICAITTTGGLSCWGNDNSTGQLGDGTTAPHDLPVPIASDRTDWVAVVARNRGACAIAADGTLACWGENRRGQIGSDTALPLQLSPHVLADSWSAVAPGLLHTCAIDSERHLHCTGGNGHGQRGDGTGGSQLEPQKLDGTWTAIETGDLSTCGLRNGQLWCWGENGSGQLGEGTVLARQAPVQTMMAMPTAALAVGARSTCNISAQGVPFCWGDNREGQLGPNMAVSYATSPSQLQNLGPVVAIASSTQTCLQGAPATPAVTCWGRNNMGQLGRDGFSAFESTYAPVIAVWGQTLQFMSVTAGFEHTCGMTLGDQQIYCWGRNFEGQLGSPGVTMSARAIGTGFPAKSVSAGSFHTCAVRIDDTLWCWGTNAAGQLGNDAPGIDVPAPLQIGSATWHSVSAGASHTCGIAGDRSLFCWGSAGRGAIGTGTREARSVPTKIGSATWSTISAGNGYTCGLQMDGSAWCWGNRLWGQLGDNRAWSTKFVQIGMP